MVGEATVTLECQYVSAGKITTAWRTTDRRLRIELLSGDVLVVQLNVVTSLAGGGRLKVAFQGSVVGGRGKGHRQYLRWRVDGTAGAETSYSLERITLSK